jgi:cysteate synthase
MGEYFVRCLNCGKYLTGFTLTCECNSLIRATYKNPLNLKKHKGIWKYIDWLPCSKPLKTKTGPITYKSKMLAKELGLSHLFIVFSGYWPEKKSFNMTCSFKDLEASPTISRAIDHRINNLIIASAGNTGRAFAHVTNITGFPIYLVIPEFAVNNIWTLGEPSEHIKLIQVKGNYSDAISIGQKISELKNITPEGGTKNIARRDGMGTVMLSCATTIGRFPDHYFQAIGSGPGAIGCWEMAIRLKNQGYFGWPKLHLSQNSPFTPMVDAWKNGRREINEEDIKNADINVKKIYAKVLSNRDPPYSLTGGVYDALINTFGETYAITNNEAKKAKKLFETLEEIDILPAPSVATASLIKSIENQIVSPEDYILLNITGGGEIRLKEDIGVHQIKPMYTINNKNFDLGEIT